SRACNRPVPPMRAPDHYGRARFSSTVQRRRLRITGNKPELHLRKVNAEAATQHKLRFTLKPAPPPSYWWGLSTAGEGDGQEIWSNALTQLNTFSLQSQEKTFAIKQQMLT